MLMNKPQRVIVTGGCGFIATNLIKRLVKEGYEVHSLDIKGKAANFRKQPGCLYHYADICDEKYLIRYIKEGDIVFHLAAFTSVPDSFKFPEATKTTNHEGTLKVARHCHKVKVKRLIYTSTAAVYGESAQLPTPETAVLAPSSPYALEKLAGEMALVTTMPRNFYIFRLFNVYGEYMGTSHEGLIAKAVHAARTHPSLLRIYGTGLQTRDYVHVNDVVELFMKAIDYEPGVWPIYNVGTGMESSVNDIALFLGLRAKWYPKRNEEPERSCADIRKVEEEMEWSPTITLDDGLRALVVGHAPERPRHTTRKEAGV